MNDTKPSRANANANAKDKAKAAKAGKPAQAAAAAALNQREAPATPPSAPSKDLQVFPNPQPGRDYVVRFDVPEFTCHCPLTGQPDFAHFWIEIVPDALCVELKSLKMYFWAYRNEGAFHERVTNTILDDIVKAIQPRFARIHADWFVRGGIRTYVTVEHRKKGWKPEPKVELPAAAASGSAGSGWTSL
jgi:7-cyano-7-deazaguanine reductase